VCQRSNPPRSACPMSIRQRRPIPRGPARSTPGGS